MSSIAANSTNSQKSPKPAQGGSSVSAAKDDGAQITNRGVSRLQLLRAHRRMPSCFTKTKVPRSRFVMASPRLNRRDHRERGHGGVVENIDLNISDWETGRKKLLIASRNSICKRVRSEYVNNQLQGIMSAKIRKSFLLVVLLSFLTHAATRAADQVVLQFRPAGLQGEVGLHSTLSLPVSAMYPEYTVWHTTNLQTWVPIAGPISGRTGASADLPRVAAPLPGDRAFYRVSANLKLAPADKRLGDASYGYSAEFARQLERIGQTSLNDFASRYTPMGESRSWSFARA